MSLNQNRTLVARKRECQQRRVRRAGCQQRAKRRAQNLLHAYTPQIDDCADDAALTSCNMVSRLCLRRHDRAKAQRWAAGGRVDRVRLVAAQREVRIRLAVG